MFREFVRFLREFNVISLAVGFVMGTASTALVSSLVKDILMPIVTPLLSAGAWQDATLRFGPVTVAYGSFVAELLNFLILAVIVFVVAKKLFKVDVSKKK